MLTLNKSKKIVCLIIVIMILLQVKTFAVVSQTNDFYVNDYAKILSSETEEYIINTNIELQKKTGAQIVVVTVSSLGGQSIEEYATELFRKFGIGDKNKNNGVLLLCSTGDRLFRIEVGYGLEGRLTDGKTGRIQDKYIIPYLKNDNYNEGIKNGFSAVLQEVCKEYNISISEAQKPEEGQDFDSISSKIIIVGIISINISVFLRYIQKVKIKLIYLVLIGIVSFLVSKSFSVTMIILFINAILLIGSRYTSRRRKVLKWTAGGFSSGGGFSGGRRFFKWWRILRWPEVLLAEAVVQEASK